MPKVAGRRHRSNFPRRSIKEGFLLSLLDNRPSCSPGPASTKVAASAVSLIQFLGLIKRRLALVKLLRAGIEGVGLVIHLVWDELPIVPLAVYHHARILACPNGTRNLPRNDALEYSTST